MILTCEHRWETGVVTSMVLRNLITETSFQWPWFVCVYFRVNDKAHWFVPSFLLMMVLFIIPQFPEEDLADTSACSVPWNVKWRVKLIWELVQSWSLAAGGKKQMQRLLSAWLQVAVTVSYFSLSPWLLSFPIFPLLTY